MHISEKTLFQIGGIAGFFAFFVYLQSFIFPPVEMSAAATMALFILCIIPYMAYMYAFALLGVKFKKPFLTKAAYTLIALNLLISAASYLFPGADGAFVSVFLTAYGLATSAAVIVLGWNVLALKNHLGWLAVWYGCLEMLTGTGVAYFFSFTAGLYIDLVLFVLGINILLLIASGRHESKNYFLKLANQPYFWASVAFLAAAFYLVQFGVRPANGCLPFNPDDPACQGSIPPSLVE